MKYGTIDISTFKIGTETPRKIYLGDTLVWPNIITSIQYTTTDGLPIEITEDQTTWGGARVIYHEYGIIGFDRALLEVNHFTFSNNLKSIVLPDTVTTLGTNLFMNMSNLSSIDIGNSVSVINNAAFYGTAITGIWLPDTLTRIGSYVFENCNKITSIDSYRINPPQINVDTFLNINSGGVLYVQNHMALNRYSSWMSTSDYYLGKYGWTIDTMWEE